MSNRDRIEPAISAVTRDLVAAGARAVVLTGSYARGDAGPRSDVDLHAVGDGPDYVLDVLEGRLVSVSWSTQEVVLEAFMSPAKAGAAVPGWRSAVILHDPDGVAAELVDRARSWDWTDIGDEALDAWVAQELTGYTEEVFKLVGMLEQGRLLAAGVQRSVLALRVPIIMATHLRLLYDSENVLWDLVGEAMGQEFGSAQATALGVISRPIGESWRAALLLYVLACQAAQEHFSPRQANVVKSASTAARTIAAPGE